MNEFKDQERDQFIAFTFHEGKNKQKTTRDIVVFLAKRLALSQNFIYSRLTDLGLVHKKGCIVAPFHEEVKQWLKEGHGLNEISNKLGISRSTLYTYCSDNLIPIPNKHKRPTPKNNLEDIEINKEHDNYKSVKRRIANKNLVTNMLKVKW